MVEVEEERVKVFARGARCVSFSSITKTHDVSVPLSVNAEKPNITQNSLLVSFHDIMTVFCVA